ncbi:MAG: hypothetical protein K0Q65_1325 [Clostridia bacterium]|jgi:uncharacterized membrane protein YcaP (DUF421 family)|nr:hypothetical protein [Clostridia bacterium]
MLIVFIRAAILYLFIVVIMRLMGKKQIGELQPTELVVALVIADLSAVPMESLNTPILYGIIPILTLFIIEEFFTFIALKSDKARGVIYGKPSILVEHGKILESEMRKQRFSINDLLEQLRIAGYPSVDEIEYAILETTGDLSTIPKSNKRAITTEDMNLVVEQEGLPITAIIDGRILSYNLRLKNLDDAWLQEQLRVNQIVSAKDVFFAFVTDQNEFKFQLKDVKNS